MHSLNESTAPTKNQPFKEFLRQRDLQIAAILQLLLSIPFAQGYDFRVSYLAGRNIVTGSSPYLGGTVTGMMAQGYGPQVQGIGETPLWPLYLGLSYYLSAGQPFIFNFLSKLPIVAANIALAYVVHSKGARGWRFYLFNVFLIITSVTWGKPDNLATYLAILALTATDSASGSALLLSTSLMIKPLAVTILPAFFSRLRSKSTKWSVEFLAATFAASSIMFVGPFVAFGWPLETVAGGFVNWFAPAGALSPFNIAEILYGTFALPGSLWWVGYMAPASILVLIAYAVLRPPRDALYFALVSASIFFTLRPWTSEQNLVMVLTLFIILNGDLPSRWLWGVPLLFAFANNSPQQQLYLLRPGIIAELNRLYASINIYRLWAKFLLASTWLAVLWVNVRRIRRKGRRVRVEAF